MKLSHEELTEVIKLSLWAGQLLLQHGAEASRVEETVHHIGTGLGCNWVDVLISSEGVLMTAINGEEFRTKVRRVPYMGVNYAIIDAVNALRYRVETESMTCADVRAELRRISDMGHLYNRWLVVMMVGLACGAFSQLFGADAPITLVTIAAASAAMFLRQQMTRHHFNYFLITATTAFVAGVIASLAQIFEMGESSQIALAASVLLLVPGVPLINAVTDILQGHVVVGVARGTTAFVIALGIAVGLLLAIEIIGVRGLL